MKNKISQKLINILKLQDKSYRVHDVTQPGLFIRVLPSGHMSYMVTWGRNKNATLGRVGVLTLEQSRKEAAKYLAEAREYGEPLAIADIRKNTVIPTLECFIDESHDPWVKFTIVTLLMLLEH